MVVTKRYFRRFWLMGAALALLAQYTVSVHAALSEDPSTASNFIGMPANPMVHIDVMVYYIECVVDLFRILA